MGGILSESQENEIIKLIRKDNARGLQLYLDSNQVPKNLLYTNHKRSLIHLSCYFESPKCLSKLIEMNYDYNQIETLTGDTPLFICAKFNNLEMVKILLANDDCRKLIKNTSNLNEFDIAFLRGNYNICYYLMYEYKNKENNINDNNSNNIYINGKNEQNENIDEVVVINKSKGQSNSKENKESEYDIHQIYQGYFYNTSFEYDYFLSLQAENKCPLFNMPLFFKCLCNKTPPSKCPSFAPERKKTHDLMTKIPDPNETWGHFFKRVTTMELYNPPMVDKKNVSAMNSMYMNAQMKLMENEYGVKMEFYKRNTHDDFEETNHPLDVEESDIIQIKKKGKTTKLENSDKSDKNEEEKKDKEIEINDIENNDIDKNEIKNENNIDNIDNEENLCVVKIGEETSERKINEEN